MISIHFEWDDAKAATNLSKHGVSFEEARTVFYDEHARLIIDPDHSDSEDRFILLGLSITLKFWLFVIVTAVMTTSYASSQLARQLQKKSRFIRKVNEYARRI